jgi:hypothetical protein
MRRATVRGQQRLVGVAGHHAVDGPNAQRLGTALQRDEDAVGRRRRASAQPLAERRGDVAVQVDGAVRRAAGLHLLDARVELELVGQAAQRAEILGDRRPGAPRLFHLVAVGLQRVAGEVLHARLAPDAAAQVTGKLAVGGGVGRARERRSLAVGDA